jgi:hypothetical protein
MEGMYENLPPKTHRTELMKCLSQGQCYVEFEKKDGTMRSMECTLKESLIPADKMPKSSTTYSEETIRVFDTDINEWRSFRVNSVKTFHRMI